MHAPHPAPRSSGRRIALLIDADNVTHAVIGEVVAHLSAHGSIHVRRAYGDWSCGRSKPWKEVLHAFAIEPVQQFAYTSGKNASDIALVIDAMELLFTHSLDAFAIVSSDADFTPLAMRLAADGRDVHGYGERKTPAPFVAACTTFHVLGAAKAAPPPREATPAPVARVIEAAADVDLIASLRRVVKATARDDGWAPMAEAGQAARKTTIDPRRYGARNYASLFARAGAFEIVKTESGIAYVGDRGDPSRASRPR